MRKVFVIFVLLSAAAGFVVLPSLLAGNSGGVGPGSAPGGAPGNALPASFGAPASASVFSVRTAPAEIRTLESYMEINGNIVSREQVAVMPETSGKIVSLRASLGSAVRKGALLAEVDPSRPGAVYSLSPVYAPVSGTVISATGAAGSTVSNATVLFVIATGGNTEIEINVPEREVGQLRGGLRAEVRLEAYPGEIFDARIVRVSPVLDPVSRTKKAVLHFDRNDARINPGMFARVKLVTRSYENAVTVNSNAIVSSGGTKAVYVVGVDPETGGTRAALREVKTGVTVDGLAEIREGLSAGESVVTQGQQMLSDGAAVRVVAVK